MTIVDTIADDHYGRREDLAFAFAQALNEEARELEALGVDVIQFDEPAFNVYMPQVAEWGMAALEEARSGLSCTTAVHICYGYGIKANLDWKSTLGSEWRQYEETFPVIARSSIDQVSLECRNSHVPIELIRLLDGKDVLVGAIDVASNAVEIARRGGRDDPGGHALRGAREALSLHQLRHGAHEPGRRLRQARGTRPRSRARAGRVAGVRRHWRHRRRRGTEGTATVSSPAGAKRRKRGSRFECALDVDALPRRMRAAGMTQGLTRRGILGSRSARPMITPDAIAPQDAGSDRRVRLPEAGTNIRRAQ